MAKKSIKSAIRRALARRPSIKPIVIKTGATVKHHAKRAVRHSRGALGGFLGPKNMGLMMGAFAVGVLEKQNMLQQLPSLPFIGRTGTIGLAAHFIAGGKPGLATDVATAALVIAAHELGSTGSIVGDGGAQGPYGVQGVDYVDAY